MKTPKSVHMSMRPRNRRSFIRDLLISGSALSLSACSPYYVRPRRIPRIGFFSGDEPSLIAAFREELTKLGYREGRNIILEQRIGRRNSPDGARYTAELTSMDLDFIVVAALPLALLVRNANPSMPMVIITCPGMVSNGFAQTLEHPGGIYTGMDELPPGLTGKRLELLKMAAPSVSRVALLSTTPGKGGHETQLADAEKSARSLGIAVNVYRAATPEQLKSALDSIAKDRADGLLNFQGGLSLVNRDLIVKFATEQRLPAIYQALLFVESGGLMAWAPDLEEQYRIGARYAHRIIQGAKPGDLPVLHPSRYLLSVNKSAAAAIGLQLPETILSRADRVTG
jgi:putative tryptophan/tyrosine transport system substrate-binding protein